MAPRETRKGRKVLLMAASVKNPPMLPSQVRAKTPPPWAAFSFAARPRFWATFRLTNKNPRKAKRTTAPPETRAEGTGSAFFAFPPAAIGSLRARGWGGVTCAGQAAGSVKSSGVLLACPDRLGGRFGDRVKAASVLAFAEKRKGLLVEQAAGDAVCDDTLHPVADFEPDFFVIAGKEEQKAVFLAGHADAEPLKQLGGEIFERQAAEVVDGDDGELRVRFDLERLADTLDQGDISPARERRRCLRPRGLSSPGDWEPCPRPSPPAPAKRRKRDRVRERSRSGVRLDVRSWFLLVRAHSNKESAAEQSGNRH